MNSKYSVSCSKWRIEAVNLNNALVMTLLVLASMVCTQQKAAASAPGQSSANSNTPSGSAINLYPAGVAFFDQFVGTLGPSQPITLTNNGTTSLSITKVVTSIPFTQTNNCGASVASGASCVISVRFKPSTATLQTGTLTVTDSAVGSPHIVSLRGTGVSNPIAFSPASLNVGTQPLNVAGGPAAITVTNISGSSVTISSIVGSGDFTQTNSCASPFPPAPSAACRVDVTFKPTAVGTRTGAITITDSAPGTPHIVQLSGIGAISHLSFSPAR